MFKSELRYVLAVLGGLAAVGVALYFTQTAGSLWGLLAVAVVVQNVRGCNNKLPAGFVACLCSLAVAAAIYMTLNAACLWALLLVAVVVEQID